MDINIPDSVLPSPEKARQMSAMISDRVQHHQTPPGTGRSGVNSPTSAWADELERRFPRKLVMIFSHVFLAGAFLSFLSQSVLAGVNDMVSWAWVGMWSGMVFCCAGGLGYISAFKTSKASIISFFVASIFASISGLVLGGFSITGLFMYNGCVMHNFDTIVNNTLHSESQIVCGTSSKVPTMFHSVMFIVGLLGLLLGVVASAFTSCTLWKCFCFVKSELGESCFFPGSSE